VSGTVSGTDGEDALEIAEGKPCPLCEAPLAARTLPEFAGDESPIRLTLRGFPVFACPAPHRYFVGQKFPIWLLNALLEGELAKVPAGVEKGLLFKKYACGACGAVLPAAGGEPRTFTSSLAWKETPGFTVEVSVPVYRCPRCGQEQARSATELAKLLPAALVHAFKAAGLKAPG
jgi:DNA-directed RNA polymerase subunit RPC12/RpoP